MNEFFIYFLKINVALALFYILFRAVFYRDTFWIGRRIYLVSAILISAVYPFVSLTGWLESREPVQMFIAEWTYFQEFVVAREAVQTSSISWQQILLAIYIAVSAVFLVRFFVQLFSVLRWNKQTQKAIIHGISVKTVLENIAPFSFFNSIYVNPNLSTDQELKEVLAHENTHARQWHSVDVMLGELLTIVCWANPFAWLLKSEIRQNLEFLADNQVVNFGFNTKKYQYHLLNLALYSPNIQLINKFNVSPLKKRIIMMNKSKTKKAGLIKYALILPATFALIFASNLLLSACTADNKVINTEEATQLLASNEVVFDRVDVMPEFPGGEDALVRFLSENISYPADAYENAIQGTVIVQFVVKSDGSIADARVLQSVHPSLDNEAIRVIEAMPTWTPGEHDGKKVRTQFNIPIRFSMPD